MDADAISGTPERGSVRAVEAAPTARSMPAWRRVAVWVAERELWVVGVVAPPLMFPERFPRSFLFFSLAVLVLIWPIRWLAQKRFTQSTQLDVPILALLLMLPASLYASADFSISLPKLTGILLGIAIFYAVVNTTVTQERVVLLSLLLIVASVLIACVSLVGTGWKGARFPFVPRLYQFLPTYAFGLTRTGMFHPNQVGGTLILFIPLNLAWLYAKLSSSEETSHNNSPILMWLQSHRRLVITFLGLSLLITLITLVLTQSRSAVLGLGVALLFLLALRNRWTAAGFILAVASTIIGVWQVGVTRTGKLLLGVAGEGMPVGTLDFAGRQEVWSRAVYMLQDFPYTGVGLGMFDKVAHVLYPFFLIGPDAVVVHAHNVYLQVGVDLGLPGLVAYVGLITAACVAAWQSSRRARSRDTRMIAVGLLGGIVAYHVYGLTDAMTLGAKPGVFLWAIMGLTAILNRYIVQPTNVLSRTQ